MLRTLSIRNFIIVEELEVDFSAGFNVLTGETGAGKSILIDALNLLLGERSELSLIRPGAVRAELAAHFTLDENHDFRAWLEENDLADGDALLLRRVLETNGRSRAYINGAPVTLAQLKTAGEALVDIHGQHIHQSLSRGETQRNLVDAFGGFSSLSAAVAQAWKAWQSAQARLAGASKDAERIAAERVALEARRDELSLLKPGEREWEELTLEQTRLAHITQLMSAAHAGIEELTDGDDALAARLSRLEQRLMQAAEYDPQLQQMATLLDSARAQMQEASHALRQYLQRVDVDPQRLKIVEERLAQLHAAARKHRLKPQSLAELLSQTVIALDEIKHSSNLDMLSLEVEKLAADYHSLTRDLSAKRRMAAAELAVQVSKTMQQLGMKGGEFRVELPATREPAAYGKEQVEFQVSAHPGQALAPLSKVASGGELSRLSLAIQVVASDVTRVPTLIFDEVDVGIGGAVAETVGRLLQKLGKRRQVLCVTHLAQVAACAHRHWQVTKTNSSGGVKSELIALDDDERVEEIARMLGGRIVTAKTRAHAKELLASTRGRK